MHRLYSFWLCVFLIGRVSFGKNVLFFTLDDMRPDLGCYSESDSPPIYSPNIDALARRSLLLKKAYVQEAVCSPSRTSFLTGRRPDTTKVFDLVTYFRHSGGDFSTIPQYFKDHGYVSLGFGKIFHPGVPSDNNDPISWSEPFFQPNESKWEIKDKSWKYVTQAMQDEEPLVDLTIARHAVHALKYFIKGGKYENSPFFLAVGFKRPHMPFVSPEYFQNLYPADQVGLPKNPYAPVNMPDIAWIKCKEFEQYPDLRNILGDINTTIPDSITKDLRRAYYSAISWVDSLVGMVIDELNRLGLGNDTVISLLGDHGWQLGEHDIWGKETNFELGTHAPLMIHIPGLTDAGIVTDKITEFVDIYPTLVDATGLPKLPICPENSAFVSACTEGESLIPLIKNPHTPWKNAAFSQYPRDRHTLEVMGYTVRTERYRYTEWSKYINATSRVDRTHTVGVELYDHANDPDENINRADDVEFLSLKKQLSKMLQAGWRAVSPTLNAPLIG